RGHARLLGGRELQAVLQLEHVQRSRIAVLVGGEGQAEAAAVGDDGVELLLVGVHAAVRRVVVAGRVTVAGGRVVRGLRGGGARRQDDREAGQRRRPHRAQLQRRASARVSAAPSRSRSATATRSCSRYCSSVLPPSSMRRSWKKRCTSASSSG